MKLPISWLNEFVKIDASVEDICNALVNVGFEVEEVILYGQDISGVVVGKILDIKAHPDADKLKICSVDVGKGKVTIITGANNVNVGDVVPVALDGAKLPNKTINAAPLRGIMSYGMMCSGTELGISEAFVDGASVNGILILDQNLTVGEDIVTALNLKETVLDVSITANRPDCHSILGLAREVATAFNTNFKCDFDAILNGVATQKIELKVPTTQFTLHKSKLSIPSVKITSPDTPVYSGALITDINIEKSPKWMQRRLFMCGINPINNVVDITNYVLLEIGQPLHAFDLAMIKDEIIVRQANNGEVITTLNGEEYKLTNEMTLICDSEKPLAIAGIMGGKYSGISQETKVVFLESARFSRGSVRNTSLKLGLRSDSSSKFERGVDYFSVEFGRKRALALFEQLNAGKVVIDNPIAVRENKLIKTTAQKINELLGISIPQKSMIDILDNLGMSVSIKGEELTVSIPQYREDIDNFTDLAEEIIRFYGYDKLTETFMPTSSVTIGGMNSSQKRIEHIKDLLCAVGSYEIMTYSFTDYKVFDKLNLDSDDARRNAIKIINPISEDLSVMKTELVSGMLSVISTNITRKNNNFRLFELAKVYEAPQLPLMDLPDEKCVLCVSAVGEKEDFYSIKNIFTSVLDYYKIDYTVNYSNEPYLHPGISADLLSNGKKICSFGKLHPLAAKNFGIKKSDVYVGYMYCDIITEANDTVVKYKPLPKFPSVERDLAFVVEEDAAVGDIIAAIKRNDALIGDVELFDIYRGEQIDKGYKSVALKIKLVPTDKTLIDAEISSIITGIVSMIKDNFGAKVRE